MTRKRWYNDFIAEFWTKDDRVTMSLVGSEFDVTDILEGSLLLHRIVAASPSYSIETTVEVRYFATPAKFPSYGGFDRAPAPGAAADVEVIAAQISNSNEMIDILQKDGLAEKIRDRFLEDGPHFEVQD